ncbi:ribosomal biogenesis factor-like [Macaca mulatta]
MVKDAINKVPGSCPSSKKNEVILKIEGAKNKLRGQKSKNVFHIANQKNFKAKNKAKPVTTNLELIPQQCHESKPVNVGEATKLMAQL